MASDHEALSRYIQEKEDFVASVLERLRWTKEYLGENVRLAKVVRAVLSGRRCMRHFKAFAY